MHSDENMPATRPAMKRELSRLEPSTFAELRDFAATVAKSGMAPKGYVGKPDDVFVAFVMGAELGLKPLQALQNIAVINGRPSIWGDALLALVISHPHCKDVRETFETDAAGNAVAVCTVLRRGRDPVTRMFGVAEAKAAKLWGKEGPWQTYSNRMLSMRARGFACRDAFPDALRGIVTVEEARDMPAEVDITDRGEVVARPGERRADTVLRAMAPKSLSEAVHQVEHQPHETIDQTTGEIREAEVVTVGAQKMDTPPQGERQIPRDQPATTPDELKACLGRIDAAMSVEDVNVELDYSRAFSPDAKRAIQKRAALRMKELKP